MRDIGDLTPICDIDMLIMQHVVMYSLCACILLLLSAVLTAQAKKLHANKHVCIVQVTRILNMNLNQRFGSHAKAFDGVPAVAGPTVGQAASKAQVRKLHIAIMSSQDCCIMYAVHEFRRMRRSISAVGKNWQTQPCVGKGAIVSCQPHPRCRSASCMLAISYTEHSNRAGIVYQSKGCNTFRIDCIAQLVWMLMFCQDCRLSV